MADQKVFGYANEAEFRKAVDREMALSLQHTSVGRDLEREQQRRPRKQAEPEFKLRGAPGSPERLQQVAELSPDPALVSEMAWGQVGTHLQNVLHQIRAYEDSDDFTGEYPPEIAEAFASSARMLASAGSPELYAAFEHELEQSGSDLTEYLPSAVQYAETEGRIEGYEVARAQEQSRLEAREQTLSREYADIQRRTGASGIAAADHLAQALNQEGLLYDPNSTEDVIRAEMRAAAEQSKAHERGLRTASYLTAMDAEFARNHGPGSSWSDAEREKWEQELRASTVETVERAFGDPADSGDRAILGMIEDDQRHKTGKSAFERALDAELAEHDSHARQNSPHLKAMAEANVEDWEETHDTDGYNRVGQDALGREHGQRYKSSR